MVWVRHDTAEIHLKLVYVGHAAAATVAFAWSQLRAHDAHFEEADDPTLHSRYLCATLPGLGTLDGKHFLFHLHALEPTDPTDVSVADHPQLAHADAVVVCLPGTPLVAALRSRFAAAWPNLPVFLQTDLEATDPRTQTGEPSRPWLPTAPAAGHGVFDGLKLVVRELIQRFKAGALVAFEPRPQFATREAALEASAAARDATYATLGTLDDRLRLRGVAPSFLRGEPAWPATLMPSLRLVRRPSGSLLLTNGLADPYDPVERPDIRHPEIGHACELFVEAYTTLPDTTELTTPRHWLEHVLWSVADFEAEHRLASGAVAQWGGLTCQIPPLDPLAHLALPSGSIAVLLGVPAPGVPPTLALPHNTAALISIQLLTPAEYDFAVASGNPGIRMLADRLAASGVHHVIGLDRPSVV